MSTWKNSIAATALAIACLGGVAKADGIPLGIVLQDTPTGVVVTEVLPGGIACRCMPRLKPGAHITTLNGVPISSSEDFRRVLQCSTFVKFQFIDPSGAHRWANAWCGGRPVVDCRP